ncbi:helix-turn-helix transcriptional regulator [Paenalcaligenes niemegkensis]|uniref:helix-turn-helix transcriptional regulator n=1 Tax=Paenalcaligenes niemegkensis TaxID=2895469 RepID=UPI001EE92477|nr:substrate-binding domain-containing protein [Paenalcaligenes niemegkensis]MCQ9617196.1 helix-turn-helix transcriptional regulator [Paenalcaligenes niemegkensis]
MGQQFKARIRSEWVLESADGTTLQLGEVLRLLAAIETMGNITGAAKACSLSYRHAWGLLRNAEKQFEAPLMETSRRQGTTLTEFSRRLLWANRRVDARLTPTLESMASELQEELHRLYSEQPQHLRLHASHGFAVEGLMRLANDKAYSPLELRYRSAIEALGSLIRRECDLAGFQVPIGKYQEQAVARYREWLKPEQHRLIYLSDRSTGLFIQQGNPRGVRSVADLLRPDVRFVNREVGSSTRFLLNLIIQDYKLDAANIQGFDSTELTHLAVAAHVASDMADVGFGVETAALRCGLDFIPLAQERYFFAIHKDLVDSALVQRFLELITGDEYQAYMGQLVGYAARKNGAIMTLEEAFGPVL